MSFYHWYEQHILLRSLSGSFYGLSVWSRPQTFVTQMFFWLQWCSSCSYHRLLLHTTVDTVCKSLSFSLSLTFSLFNNIMLTIYNLVILIFHIVILVFSVHTTSIAVCPSWKRVPSSVALPEVSSIFSVKWFFGDFLFIQTETSKYWGCCMLYRL